MLKIIPHNNNTASFTTRVFNKVRLGLYGALATTFVGGVAYEKGSLEAHEKPVLEQTNIFNKPIELPEDPHPYATLRRILEECNSNRNFERMMIKGGVVTEKYLENLRQLAGEEYEALLSNIRHVAIGLEKLSPGASLHIKGWLTDAKNLDRVNECLKLVQRYAERLAVHGETDIADALASFNLLKVPPSETLVDKLLRLHWYSGIVRINRFIDSNDPKRSEKLNKALNYFIDNFEGRGYKKDSKVTVAYITGVTQDFEEPPKSDMFANPKGAPNVLESLIKNKCKVLIFEFDKPQTRIPRAIVNAFIASGGKPVEIIVPAGHGNSLSTNFGVTKVPRAFVKPDENYRREVIKRNRNYTESVDREIKEGKRKLIKWEIENIANGKVKTLNDGLLDITDVETMRELKMLMDKGYISPDAVIIFASCNVAREQEEGFSLAKKMNEETGMVVFGCTKPIDNINPVFEDGHIIEVKYYKNGKLLPGTRFSSRENESN